jgi:hypothetical protein
MMKRQIGFSMDVFDSVLLYYVKLSYYFSSSLHFERSERGGV